MIALMLSVFVLVVAVLAAWKDYSSYGKAYRLVLIVLSGLLLIGFLMEPEWWPGSSIRYALLTTGTENQDFREADYDTVYTLRESDKSSEKRKWLSSVSLLPDHIPTGSLVDLFGYGVEDKLPANLSWNGHLNTPPPGLLSLDVPHQFQTGRESEIQLRAAGPVMPGDTLSVMRDGQLWNRYAFSERKITFTDRLTMPGPVSYDLEWETRDEIIRETIHVRAVQPDLLKIGILTYSPSFELNYLADHFGSRGHVVISRSRIGQDRFRFDAVNAPLEEAESFIDQLSKLDVLFLDSREYAALSVSEQYALEEAVTGGLDVVLLTPDIDQTEQWEEVFSSLSKRDIKLNVIDRLEERNWLPDFLSNQQDIVTPLPLINAEFETGESGRMLYDYTGGAPVSFRLRNQGGSVSGHLFYQSYRWLIEGSEEAYNGFWVDYLSHVITLEKSRIELDRLLPKVHEKLLITITQPREFSRAKVKSVYEADTLSLPVSQSLQNPEVSTVSFWPEKTGWHFAEYGGRKKWFYVYGKDEWESAGSWNRFVNTADQLAKAENREDQDFEGSHTKVPDWMWLIGFLSIQFVLWVERKFVRR